MHCQIKEKIHVLLIESKRNTTKKKYHFNSKQLEFYKQLFNELFKHVGIPNAFM